MKKLFLVGSVVLLMILSLSPNVEASQVESKAGISFYDDNDSSENTDDSQTEEVDPTDPNEGGGDTGTAEGSDVDKLPQTSEGTTTTGVGVLLAIFGGALGLRRKAISK